MILNTLSGLREKRLTNANTPTPIPLQDKRVKVDFEVEFSNGGGLQGQGFRLDITGDDISDEALAGYIIRDLRLLMVGSVRILNKEIFTEQHKRSVKGAQTGSPPSRRRLIDLSHTVTSGMITYKGLPAPVVCDYLSREASREHYAEGTEFHIGRIDMVANTGTYVDSPFHRYPDGKDLSELDLESVADLPGIVVRQTGMAGRAIGRSAFAASEVSGKAVLVHTGWAVHWGSERYFEGHPFSGFRFSAAPVKVKGMGTFPVRAYAVIEPDAD